MRPGDEHVKERPWPRCMRGPRSLAPSASSASDARSAPGARGRQRQYHASAPTGVKIGPPLPRSMWNASCGGAVDEEDKMDGKDVRGLSTRVLPACTAAPAHGSFEPSAQESRASAQERTRWAPSRCHAGPKSTAVCADPPALGARRRTPAAHGGTPAGQARCFAGHGRCGAPRRTTCAGHAGLTSTTPLGAHAVRSSRARCPGEPGSVLGGCASGSARGSRSGLCTIAARR